MGGKDLREDSREDLGEDLGEDSDKGFSYIISSWLIEEEQECTAMTLYISRLLTQLPQKIYSVFL